MARSREKENDRGRRVYLEMQMEREEKVVMKNKCMLNDTVRCIGRNTEQR